MTNLLQQKFLAVEKRVDPYSNDSTESQSDEIKNLILQKVDIEEKIRDTERKEKTLVLANQQIKILKDEIKKLEKVRSQQKFAGFLFSDNLKKRIHLREELNLKKQNLEKEISLYAAEYDKSHDYKIEAKNLEKEIKQLLKKRKFLKEQADEKSAALVEIQTRVEKYKNLKRRLSSEINELTKSNDSLIIKVQENLNKLDSNVLEEKLPALPSNRTIQTKNLRPLYYQSRFLYNFINKAKDDFEKIINAYEFENQSQFVINYHEKKQLLTMSVESISLEKQMTEDFFQRKSQLLKRNNINNTIQFDYTPNKLVKSLKWTINVNDLVNRRGTSSTKNTSEQSLL